MTESLTPRPDKTNADLKTLYDNVYREGEDKFFSKFVDGQNVGEAEAVVLSSADWRGKTVLDIGCGTGMLVRMLREAGAARVVGLDYSGEAIAAAREQTADDGVAYVCSDVFDYEADAGFDVVVSMGTMEHMDAPAEFLGKVSSLLAEDGSVIITCPHFINVRGFVWMALALLQDVPMSLSDLHFVHPWHMQAWAEGAGLRIEAMRSCDHSRGNQKLLVRDFDKRLRNALSDARIATSGVDGYLDYLASLTDFMESQGDHFRLDGATALYRLSRS